MATKQQADRVSAKLDRLEALAAQIHAAVRDFDKRVSALEKAQSRAKGGAS